MKTRVIIFIVPIILLALALMGGSSLLMRLFFLTLLVLLVSYLWVIISIRRISVQVEKPPEHCQVGEKFRQEITIFNSSRIPKFLLKLEENADMAGEHNTQMLNLLPKNSHRWRTQVYCRRRGRYSVGSVLVTAVDPFGLFSRQRHLGEPYSIIVFPATIDLPLFNIAAFNDFSHGSGKWSIRQIGPNASSVREFAIGDSLHHIHWHSTAHTGKLMVKVFDADRSQDSSKTLRVILDMQEASHCGEGEETTEEYSVTIAASVIRKYLESGMRAGLMMVGDETYLFPPERGEEHLWSILEALALIKATGKVSISQLISEQMKQLSGDSMVVIISPSATEQLMGTIRQLRNRVSSVAVVLLDAASFGGDTEATQMVRSLSSIGVQAYIVRKGDDLTRMLSDRFSVAHLI